MRNLILSGRLSVLLVSVHVLGDSDVLFSDTVHADAFTSGKLNSQFEHNYTMKAYVLLNQYVLDVYDHKVSK